MVTVMVIVIVGVVMGVADSSPTPLLTPMEHAFPDIRGESHAYSAARHAHLLGGVMGGVESFVFDDVVEFMFQQLGEAPPEGR